MTLDSLVDKALSRRSFLAGAGAVAAGTALAGCSNDGTTSSTAAYGDTDVLNFALNLEYLEAQFYSYAATGKPLSSTLLTAPSGYTGAFTQGTVTVNSTVAQVGTGTGGTALTVPQQEILNEIAYEEQQHVAFLRSALGSAAVPMPNIDLTFFAPLATNLSPAVTGFNPFLSFDYFLVGAYIFEDVGVTAYSGAAPLISAAGVTSGYLTAAAGILAVEAYHAAYIRTSLTGRAITAGSAAAYPYLGVANSIATLRASLTVGNNAAPTLPPTANGSVETLLTFPTSVSTPSAIVAAGQSNAVGFARTVNQVHHIVYGSATVGVKSGGFFPTGTNSIFATTTA
jgi:hypothetical protein